MRSRKLFRTVSRGMIASTVPLMVISTAGISYVKKKEYPRTDIIDINILRAMIVKTKDEIGISQEFLMKY